MLIIGSKAMISQIPHTLEREARMLKSDYDVIMSESEFFSFVEKYKHNFEVMYPSDANKYKIIAHYGYKRKQYEIEIAYPGTSAAFLYENKKDVTSVTVKGLYDEEYLAVSLPYLMMTKKSHLIFPVHFEKNMEDYHLLKSIVINTEITEKMKEYYNLRHLEAKKRYKQRTPKLNVTNDDFFSSKLMVEQFFIHDDIHEVMKHHQKPVYEMMKRDFDSAWCEKDLFFELPFDFRIQAVQEEAYTIALERYIIPKYKKVDYKDFYLCYQSALKRICTTLCSGWFREFAIENYPIILERYDENFVNKFESAYKNGEIKTIEDKKWSLH